MNLHRLTLALLAALTIGAGAAAKGVWESASPVVPQAVSERMDEGQDAEISVERGAVWLALTRPATVKVLTILGQVVSQEQLPAGIHRLRLTTRGIYIVKVGSLTRRITL